jgi:hypothetical protein
MPTKTIAVKIVRCIALSCSDNNRRAFGKLAMQDNARSSQGEDEV